MLYKKTYKHHNICLKISTNSRRIARLIENVLDFNSSSKHVPPEITIRFYFNKLTTDNLHEKKRVLYWNKIRKNASLDIYIGKKETYCNVNPKTRTVYVDIFNFKELSKERILDVILMQPIRYILAHNGLFFLHASTLRRGKDGILISGPQNCGKSSLAIFFGKNGFDFMADDDCFIKLTNNKIAILPFPTKIGLNSSLLSKHKELKKHVIRGYTYGTKCRASAHNLFSNSDNKIMFNCKLILFPQYTKCKNITLKKLSSSEALRRLCKMRYTPYTNEVSKKEFWTFYCLTKKAGSYIVKYNDSLLRKIPPAVEKIL